MLRANEAKVEWNAEKKHWQVVIAVGAEVIRRTCADKPRDSGDEDLRSVALSTAKDEGYELDPSQVSIVR